MAGLYTGTGDAGNTGLYGGTRVGKDDLRIHSYGTIDESNAMIGLAYSFTDDEEARCRLRTIQQRLIAVAAELASDDKGLGMLKDRISKDDATYLEDIVDTCMEFAGPLKVFVLPGANSFSAALHAARTVVRRAERCIVELSGSGTAVREELLRYVNRLSDCLFAMARREEMLTTIRRVKDRVLEKLHAQEGVSMGELTLETARRLALYAEEKAEMMQLPIVFSAVDEGGNLVLLNRMEGALIASIDISIKKAYTANALKMPTDLAGQLAGPDAPLCGLERTNDNRFVLFGGGYPFKADGEVVGGIGVSGGSVEQDMEIASYALDRFQGGEKQNGCE